MLEPGAGVVTSRADVHYVVTEHGIAYLHGKTLRERAEALIAIADPRFQEELEDFAVRVHYLEREKRRLRLPERRRFAGEEQGMTDVGKRDRGLLRVDVDECKGCGLCMEACPPKVIAHERAVEPLRLSHGGVCGRGLHGVRNLLHGLPGAGSDHGVARGDAQDR